jgi:hypothetical protein
MREMNLLLLKCVITNKELSLTARFDAYDAYKAAGGNGWVERYVAKHLNDTDESLTAPARNNRGGCYDTGGRRDAGCLHRNRRSRASPFRGACFLNEEDMDKNAVTQLCATVLALAVILAQVLSSFVSCTVVRRAAERDREQWRLGTLLLKCVITNKELSRSARLEAYGEYKAGGGNGWVDRYVARYLNDIEAGEG